MLAGLPLKKIYRFVQLGDLTGFGDAGRMLVSVASIYEFLDRHTVYPGRGAQRCPVCGYWLTLGPEQIPHTDS